MLSKKYRLHLWTFAALALSVALYVGVTRGELGLTTDGSVYIGSARVFVQDGAIASEYAFSEQLARRGNPGGGAAEPGEREGSPRPRHPLTAWAPAYSVVIAALMAATGVSDLTAAWWVNLAALAGIVVLCGLLGRRVAASDSGLFTAVAVGLMPCVVALACFVSSEPLFLFLMLLALWGLSHWADSPDTRPGACLLAAVAAAAATYTRYIGFTLALTLGLTVIWAFARVRRPRVAVAGLASGALYGLLVLPLVLRNIRLTGHMSGTERLPATRGLLENLRDALLSLLSAGPLPPLFQNVWLLLLSSALFWAYLLVLGLPRGPRAPPARPEDARLPGMGARRVLGLFAVLYGAVLVAIETHTEIDPISFRLMGPALVCLLVLAVGSAARRASFERTRLATLVFGGLCVAASLFGVQAVMPRWRALNDPHFRQLPLAKALQQEIVPSLEAGAATLFTDSVPWVYELVRGPIHWWPSPQSLPALVTRASGDSLVFLKGTAGGNYFPCKAYSAAYERVLDRFASRAQRHKSYSVWWLPREPALAASLEVAVADLLPEVLCAPDGPPAAPSDTAAL